MDSASGRNAGEGDAQGPPPRTSERRLEERALREGWPISPEQRQAICNRLMDLIEQKSGDPAAAPVRYVVQAAKTLITADRLNLEHDKHQRRADSDAEHLEDLTDESEHRAHRRRRQRPRAAD